MMFRAALRDLQRRHRRFLMAIVAAGLVLALGLVTSGLTASFRHEARRTVSLAGADTWVVAAGAAGPFTTTLLLDDDAVAGVRSASTGAAEPVLVTRQSVRAEGEPTFTIVVGVTAGGLGSPVVADGRPLRGDGEIVVDRRLGAAPGDTIDVAGQRFTVVGAVRSTIFAATPAAYVTLADARALSVDGAALSSAVLVRGLLGPLPAGVRALPPSAAVDDALEPLKSANGTIAMMRSLLWLVAALVVGIVLYLQVLDRTRDIAVFKATGTSTGAIAGGLVLQAVVVAAGASVVAAALATVLAPRFPMPAEITPLAYATLPVVALVLALVGAAAGLRRAVVVPPTSAFGDAS